jgi:hypothetical protein|tara:strand:+ start:4287 stop:5582 length:1296 start_codon:yes stop_codon:yes gene_type:complete
MNDKKNTPRLDMVREKICKGWELVWGEKPDLEARPRFFCGKSVPLKNIYIALSALELSEEYSPSEFEFRASITLNDDLYKKPADHPYMDLALFSKKSNICRVAASVGVKEKNDSWKDVQAPLESNHDKMRDWFRGSDTPVNRERYKRVMEAIFEFYNNHIANKTIEVIDTQKNTVEYLTHTEHLHNLLAKYEIPDYIAHNHELMYFEGQDFALLKNYLKEKGLLTQAANAGFFTTTGTGSKLLPEFSKGAIVAPNYELTQVIGQQYQLEVEKNPIDARVWPISRLRKKGLAAKADYLYGPVGPARHFEDRFFLEENLQRAPGGVLYITINEMHALWLKSGKDCVIGCNGSFDLSDKLIERLVKSWPHEIRIAMPPIKEKNDEWYQAALAAHSLKNKIETYYQSMAAKIPELTALDVYIKEITLADSSAGPR